ncbi:death-associated protein 1-like [Pollicipes pollicipes]|uniref:death-associated protein 1-like n=1 Tax=Pollicipes pollicipes TaxID=41117 RepID=UPI001884CDEB|nr:death-associated protein 1-like [Pollicipes pollicipes]
MADDPDQKAAGHSPAVKVGGARVVQKKPHKDSEGDGKEAAAADSTQAIGMFSQSPPKLSVTSGQPTADDTNREFPTEAVKHIHEKPKPSQVVPRPSQQGHFIHQPKK